MKKFIITVIVLLAPITANATLRVFACEPEWAALTRELAGDEVKIFTATNALQDPHYIQARPSLISRLRRADLLVCTGGGLEVGWLPVLLRRSANPRVQPGQVGHFMAADSVNLIDRPQHVDRSEGDIHPEGDPHFITDPRNLLPIASALSQRLQQLDAGRGQRYQQNLQSFEQRWQPAIQRWAQQAQPLRGIQVISQHKSWSYLLRWLGIQEAARLEPKPGIPPSTAYLARVLSQTQQQPVQMILRAAYQDDTSSQWLHEKSGIPIVVLPYTVGGNDQATDLYSLYEDTLQRMLKVVQHGN